MTHSKKHEKSFLRKCWAKKPWSPSFQLYWVLYFHRTFETDQNL